MEGEGVGQLRCQDFISRWAQSPGKIRGPMGLVGTQHWLLEAEDWRGWN